MTNIGFGGFQLDRRSGRESGACCQVQEQENREVCEAKEGSANLNTKNNRVMQLTQFQKTTYETKGRDKCPICQEILHVGDTIIVKYNGNKCTLYHKECYAKTVIEIE